MGNAGQAKRWQSPWRWFAQGWRAFFAIVSVISLANIAAHHGFEWRAYFGEIVSWYRSVFLPFRDLILNPVMQPLAAFFHWRVDAIVLDIATIVVLAFGAANAESVVRHGRPLAVQYAMLVRGVLSWVFDGSLDDMNFLDFGERPFALAIPGILVFALVLHALTFVHPNAETWVALALGVMIFGGICGLGLRATSNTSDGGDFAFAASCVLFVAPAAVFLLIVLFSAPVLAWRTAVVCCGLFAVFAAVNLLVPT